MVTLLLDSGCLWKKEEITLRHCDNLVCKKVKLGVCLGMYGQPIFLQFFYCRPVRTPEDSSLTAYDVNHCHTNS